MLYILGAIGFISFIVSLVFIFACDDGVRAIICVIVGVVCIFSSFFCYTKVTNKIDHYEMKTDTLEIVSLSDNSQIEGAGRIGCFAIATNEKYIFYCKNDDGSYTQEKVAVEETKIYEEDNCKLPRIETYTTFSQNNWSEAWTKFLLFSSKDGEEYSIRYEIHVPKGTIVQQFNLDAK